MPAQNAKSIWNFALLTATVCRLVFLILSGRKKFFSSPSISGFVRIEQVRITEGPDVAHILYAGPQIYTSCLLHRAYSEWKSASKSRNLQGLTYDY